MFTSDGRRVRALSELEAGADYVCCGNEKFEAGAMLPRALQAKLA